MPLKKFWSRFFNTEVEFQVLKSRSAVELACYSTTPASTPVVQQPVRAPRKNHQRRPPKSRSASAGREHEAWPKRRSSGCKPMAPSIPRYYSQYDSFGYLPPVTQIGLYHSFSAGNDYIQDNNSADVTNSLKRNLSFASSFYLQQKDEKTFVCFCFMEDKPTSRLHATTSMEPGELAAVLLAEEEPISDPLIKDQNLHNALTLCHHYRRQCAFEEGILLKTVESKSLHSYIHYATFRSHDNENRDRLARDVSKLNRRSALEMKYRQQQGVYEELFSMARASQCFDDRAPTSRYTGYIILGYKLLTLENRERLESTWSQWSGAAEIARHAPKQWLLQRITFHRQISLGATTAQSDSFTPAPDGFAYVLLCEFSCLMRPANVIMGCDFIERLRRRGCGQVGIFKVQWSYGKLDHGLTEVPTSTIEEAMRTLTLDTVHRRESVDSSLNECCHCECFEKKHGKKNGQIQMQMEADLLQLSPLKSESIKT